MGCLRLPNSINFSISTQFQRSELQSKIILSETWTLPRNAENPKKKEANIMVYSH